MIMRPPTDGPDFEHEVRARLGITGADFLARLKFHDLDGFPVEDVTYLINLGKDQGNVPNE